MSPRLKEKLGHGLFVAAMVGIGVAAVLLAARWVQLLINWMEMT